MKRWHVKGLILTLRVFKPIITYFAKKLTGLSEAEMVERGREFIESGESARQMRRYRESQAKDMEDLHEKSDGRWGWPREEADLPDRRRDIK